jgi:hypothetical protein
MEKILSRGVSLADSRIGSGFWPLISNLVSLVRHVEASIAFCELATDAHGQDEIVGNNFVLDDVTPQYRKAGGALIVCEIQLRKALHVLLLANRTSTKVTGKNAIVSLSFDRRLA